MCHLIESTLLFMPFPTWHCEVYKKVMQLIEHPLCHKVTFRHTHYWMCCCEWKNLLQLCHLSVCLIWGAWVTNASHSWSKVIFASHVNSWFWFLRTRYIHRIIVEVIFSLISGHGCTIGLVCLCMLLIVLSCHNITLLHYLRCEEFPRRMKVNGTPSAQAFLFTMI